MARSNQLDLFGTETQAEGFAEDTAPFLYRADPDRVRARLHEILAEVRSAQTMPWSAKELGLYQTIFPQMTNWLPEEEAAELRSELEAELTRLSA